MPPSPEPKNADVVRAGSLGAAVAERHTAARHRHRIDLLDEADRAPFLARRLPELLKNDRIRQAVIPCHMETNDGAGMNMNGTPACLAIALARKVLPVPGGPRTGCRGAASRRARRGRWRSPRKTSSVLITSSTWVSRPLISVSPISTCSG